MSRSADSPVWLSEPMSVPESPRPTVLIATPSLDAYGSDLQMLQSAIALSEAGWRVVVVAPGSSQLTAALAEHDIEVDELEFPVLRRASASGLGLVSLLGAVLRSLPGMIRTLRTTEADVLFVNTVTLPWWLAAGRLGRVATLCHVHEAEARDRRVVRRVLTLPLLLAHRVIVNSRTTEATMVDVVPRLRARTRLVYNGVEPPTSVSAPAPGPHPMRLVVVGRLSPRKGPDVALEATALLRAAGRNVIIELCGTPAAGMEWFEDRLRERAARPDLANAVVFSGYTSPIWSALARADVVVAPSLGESFGNAVVEGQLACRPVVATALQGHLETIEDGETGLLVPGEDPAALAAAVSRLLDDPDLADRLARQGRESALTRFSAERYRDEIRVVVTELAGEKTGPRSRRRLGSKLRS